MSRNGDGLIVWALATFHASAFVLVAIFLIYRGGGLGQALQGLNTLVGFALFLALWTTTFFATRGALRGFDVAAPSPIDGGLFIWRALRWGAMNGITFFAVLAAGVIVSLILTHLSDFVQSLTGPTVLQGVGIAALYITFGSLFASAIGGVVGLVFAGIDLILLGIAARIVRARPA
jgi:hypothetical protein